MSTTNTTSASALTPASAGSASFTNKVIKALKLEDKYRDQNRTMSGDYQIIEHIPSKKMFVVPVHWIDLCRKHRGYMQLAAMEEIKKMLLNHEKMPAYPYQ